MLHAWCRHTHKHSGPWPKKSCSVITEPGTAVICPPIFRNYLQSLSHAVIIPWKSTSLWLHKWEKKLYHFAKQECELRVHGKLKCEEEKIILSPPRARLFAFRYPPPYPAIAVILSCFDIQPASPRSKEEYSEERQLECGSWLRRTQFEWMKQDFFFFFYWACNMLIRGFKGKCHL